MNEKHKLMKPKDPARIGRQATRRAKKWQSLSALLLTFLMFAGFFSSCVDEFPAPGMTGQQARAEGGSTGTGLGLIQQSNGYWMSQNCRVPLVGPGRVVSKIGNGGLANVGSGSNKVGNAVDMDLSNYTTTTVNVVSADVYNTIISIRDLHHVYSGGQEVGFVFKEDGVDVLSLDVLNGITIQTLLDGEVQETQRAEGDQGFLNLNLLSIKSGEDIADREVSFVAASDKPFDEVRLSLYGVSVGVIATMTTHIKYAFVGENPEIPATSDSKFDYFWGETDPNVNTDERNTQTFISNQSFVVDADLTNCASFAQVSALSSLIGGAFLTVDFNRTIPAGYEVGFHFKALEVLDLGLFSVEEPRLIAYNDDDRWWTDGLEETGDMSIPKVNVLSLGVATGGNIVTQSMLLTKSCKHLKIQWMPTVVGELLQIGGKEIYYAYVRKPVTLDPVNYFTIGDDETFQTSYKLPVPTTGFVGYEIIEYPGGDWPEGVTPTISTTHILRNMLVDGPYKIKATYTDPNGNKMSQTATITKKTAEVQDGCNIYITAEEHGATIGSAYDWSGGIIEIVAKTDNPTNVIDGLYNTYATFWGVASVGRWDDIVSIDLANPITATTKMRVGFEIQAITGLLDLSTLSRYRIALYHNKKVVKESNVSATGGSVLNIGILNFDNSRVRLSVEIDPNETFDHLELWSDGLLAVADGLKIYNAFYENSAECIEDGPNQICMEVMTDINYGLDLDYDHIESSTVVGLLGSGMYDMDDMLDGSLDTYARIDASVLNVAGGANIALKFNEQPKNQPIGIVIDNPGDVLTVKALAGIQLKAYNDETLVGESNVDFITANVDLLTKNGKTYIEILGEDISNNYNRIEITSAATAGLIDLGLRICGVYTRPDYDGDGIPDCTDDTENTDIRNLSLSNEHICLGDPAPTFIVTSGGSQNLEYSLSFKDYAHPDKETRVIRLKVDVNKEGLSVLTSEGLEQFISELTSGYYGISIDENKPTQQNALNNICFLSIHPREATWLGNSTNWNDWDNWNTGVPWDCTDVILPENVSAYPDLVHNYSRSEIYDAPFYCKNIYFAPGAELVGQHKLNYSGKAFIDKKMDAGAYQLMSAPLRNMLTGDMFISSNASEWEAWRKTEFGNHFKDINGTAQDAGNTAASTYMEQRTAPLIYQRFWNQEVRNETLSRANYNTTDPAIAEVTLLDWSRSFNAVESPYVEGQGFAIRAGGENSTGSYTFHFPKSYTGYKYYDMGGNVLKESGTIRTEDDLTSSVGKLWIDANSGSLLVPLYRESEGKLFLFGNPLMSHIDIAKLLKENQGRIVGVKVYNNGNYDSYTQSDPGAGQIAPMEAVFVESATSATECYIQLTEAMLEQGGSVSTTAAAPNQLRLTATSRGHSASCVVVPSSVASDDYDAREDATLLVGSEEGSGVAVYTVAGGKALSIQRMNSQKRIPVGFYLKEEGSVSLSFDPQGDAWQGWTLVDSQTGKRYPLDSEINLGTVKSGAGRFYLERTGN